MSSRGQDVVDSWEEIDEERLGSRLSTLANEDVNAPSIDAKHNGVDGCSASGQSSGNSLPAMLDEELRPRMILQRPQMQILRRPQPNIQEDKTAAESKPKTQIKSLDQRKQEYAEARLRILGSAHDEEEQQQKQIEPAKKGSPNTNGYRINNNTSTGSIVNNNVGAVRLDRPQSSYRQPPPPPHPGNFHIQQHQPPHPSAFYPPLTGGRSLQPTEAAGSHHYFQQHAPHPTPGAYNHYLHHHQQSPLIQQKQLPPYGMVPQSNQGYHHGQGSVVAFGQIGGHNSNNNVLRMPAGPDGSHGFTMRR